MTPTSALRTVLETTLEKGKGRILAQLLQNYGNWIYIPLSLLLLVLSWETVTVHLSPPSYILPAPSDVLIALKAGIMTDLGSRASLLYQLTETLRGTFFGFAIGSTIGIILGSLISEFGILERVLLPYVVGLQSIPKVALAPLIVVWFGFGQESKIAMAALITFFPVVINCIAGLTSVEPERIELMRSLSASRWQTFKMVKFPSAMPFVFASFDMAIVYALLGAIVAEFVGAQRGIGVMILVLGSVNDTAGVFACLLVLGLTGITLHTISRVIEKRVVFWVYREEVVATA